MAVLTMARSGPEIMVVGSRIKLLAELPSLPPVTTAALFSGVAALGDTLTVMVIVSFSPAN